jgi:hypothetical protein
MSWAVQSLLFVSWIDYTHWMTIHSLRDPRKKRTGQAVNRVVEVEPGLFLALSAIKGPIVGFSEWEGGERGREKGSCLFVIAWALGPAGLPMYNATGSPGSMMGEWA